MASGIKNFGGNLVRVLQALDGFKGRFGYWPSEVHLCRAAITSLQDYHLTAEGFARLSAFVNLVPVEDIVMIARGPDGSVFNYGEEGFDGPKPPLSAARLLGLE
jgi:hypothetical protein